MCICTNIYIYAVVYEKITWKTEVEAIFLNTFTVCSSRKRKFVVFPFVDEETNGSYPFASGLDGFAHRRERAIPQYGNT
jgi:hypothetical protein